MRKLPFKFSPALAAKKSRLHRLKRKGITPATDKQSLRDAAERAAAIHHITRIP
jgi:hypothetical protein